MFHNQRMPNKFYKPTHTTFYPFGRPQTNRSSQNLNFSRDFEHFQMPPHGFNSIPKGPYSFWRQNINKFQRQYPRTSAFHFQDKSTFYYMSDPIITHDNRITIQLTKVHIGLNGDQQRVFVEQEFSNENELKKFMKNLRANFEKTFDNHDETQSTSSKKTGVIVIEEPDDDEEPKMYEQEISNENLNYEQDQQLPLMSSCSTIQSNKYRRHKMKYQRQYERSPSSQYQKQNDYSIPSNNNSYWKFNGYQNRSRPTSMKDQEKPPSSFRRTQQPPRTIAESFVFTSNKIRVDRSKSECQPKIPFQNRNKIPPQYFNHQQRCSIPLVFPSTPQLFRNRQIQFRLFNNLYQTNSKRF